MKNTNFSRFAKLWVAALVLVCGVAFTGCKPEVQYRDITLEGTWESTYGEIFKITATDFANSGSWGDSYAGNNLLVMKTSETSGYIYFKYTKALCTTHSDFTKDIYTYDDDASDVGKWYAISYKNLTDTSISIAGAAGAKPSTATLTEAVKEFTIENNYFSFYSECTKK